MINRAYCRSGAGFRPVDHRSVDGDNDRVIGMSVQLIFVGHAALAMTDVEGVPV
jgi:hypothetical protein